LATGIVAVSDSSSATVKAHATVKSGGTLTVAEENFPTTLDPATGTTTAFDYESLAYDPLIYQEPNGTFAPDLATKWSYGPDNESFSITLRPKVKFSDGSTMTAAGVKAWIEHDKSFAGGAGGGYFASLSSITLQGNLSLTLHFSAPTPNLETYFDQTFGMGDIGSMKGLSNPSLLTDHTDGAGPYMLSPSKTVSEETYTYVPNPHYWNKSLVHWKTVVIKVVSSPSASLSALEAGQIQIAEVQPATSAAAAKRAGLKVDAPLQLIMTLVLNDRTTGPLSNPLVREALEYAVNRPALNKLLGVGYGVATDQFAVPGDQQYDPALANYYTYNPTYAKQLLTEAGYPNGFTFTCLSVNEAQLGVLADALVGEFAAIGVTLQPTIEPTSGQFGTELGTTDFPSYTVSWGRITAVQDYQYLWGQPGPFANTDTGPLTTLYNELLAAPPSKVDSIARQMQQYIVQQAWYINVSGTPLASFYSPKVTGVDATPARPFLYLREVAPKK